MAGQAMPQHELLSPINDVVLNFVQTIPADRSGSPARSGTPASVPDLCTKADALMNRRPGHEAASTLPGVTAPVVLDGDHGDCGGDRRTQLRASSDF